MLFILSLSRSTMWIRENVRAASDNSLAQCLERSPGDRMVCVCRSVFLKGYSPPSASRGNGHSLQSRLGGNNLTLKIPINQFALLTSKISLSSAIMIRITESLAMPARSSDPQLWDVPGSTAPSSGPAEPAQSLAQH